MRLLPMRSIEKVWGRDILPPPFVAPTGKRIGEIWFEPPDEIDSVLVKYLFTSEKLSVQVHPSDMQAPPGSTGKEECWLVLDAEPDARLAIGFDRDVGAEEMRSAAQDGSIEKLLTWHKAEAGDFFHLPAGTVHAIGPGLSLLEVQQNCDMTYRLFDYGRPRELHLEDAIRVARGTPHGSDCRRKISRDETVTLVDGPFFRLVQATGVPDTSTMQFFDGRLLVLPLEGEVGGPDGAIATGFCGLCDRLDTLDFSGAKRTLLVAAAC